MYLHHFVRSFVRLSVHSFTLAHITSFLSLALQFTLFIYRIFGQHFQLFIVLGFFSSSFFPNFVAVLLLMLLETIGTVFKQTQQLLEILWNFYKATRLANEQLKLVQMHHHHRTAHTKNKLKTRLFNSIWKALPATTHIHSHSSCSSIHFRNSLLLSL